MDRSGARERYLMGIAGGAIAAAMLVLPLAIIVEDRLPGSDEPATTAPSEPPGDLDPAVVAAGSALYQASCSVCHGPDATGIPGLGKTLVASEFVDGLSDAGLVAFITVGRTPDDPLNTTGVAMPAKGGNPALSPDDLGAIVTFIRSLR